MMVHKSVYKALPTVYITIGTLLVMTLDPLVRAVPGLLFIAAGLLVFNWRINARDKGRWYG